MKVIETSIPGVVVLEPRVFNDARGYFFESYSKRVFDAEVAPVDFVQDNESMSTRGVMRGLHFQRPPHTQAKLVRCVRGAVLDVAVFQYKCDNYYAPDADGGIQLCDDTLGIDWRIDIADAILSDKDRRHPLLRDFDSPFIF